MEIAARCRTYGPGAPFLFAKEDTLSSHQRATASTPGLFFSIPENPLIFNTKEGGIKRSMGKKMIADHQLIPEETGNRYSFLCGVTGAKFPTTRIYHADTPQQELQLAWQSEGRQHFNQCQRCGKWVVDVAYNPEVLECVVCAPFEPDVHYCRSCGVRAPAQARLCPVCNAPLYYEGVGAYDPEAKK